MRRSGSDFRRWILAAALAAAAVTGSAQQGSGASGAVTAETRPSGSLPFYRPPARGAPAARVGGATRGTGADTPALHVVAPDHVGLTARAQPVLYWFVSRDLAQPVEITVINHFRVDPLLRIRLDPPVAAGIHAVALAEHGVRLEPGDEYQWFVAIVHDPERRSSDTVAGGYVQRIEGAPATADDAVALAERGLWYDAFEAATRAAKHAGVRGSGADGRLGLLEQVGLAEVAAFERAAGG